MLAVHVPPGITVFSFRHLNNDLVLSGIEVLMALLALNQNVEHLGPVLPAERRTLPQKSIPGVATPGAAIVTTARGCKLHTMMDFDKRKVMQCESAAYSR